MQVLLYNIVSSWPGHKEKYKQGAVKLFEKVAINVVYEIPILFWI